MVLLDTLFMVAKTTGNKVGVIYARPGQTAHEAWENAVKESEIGKGVWMEKGFRATRVQIIAIP